MPPKQGPVVLQMPALSPAQQAIHDCPARFRVCPLGRRVGKTHLGTAEAVAAAVKGGAVWWIAPDTNRLGPGLKVMKSLAHQLKGMVQARQTKAKSDIFYFPNGGYVEFRTANDPQVLRGDALDLAIFDEFAFMPPEAWAEAVSPMLVDRMGRALFLGTPYGRGQMYQLYQSCRAFLESDGTGAPWKRWENAAGDPDWAAFRFTSYDNPFIPRSEIDRERRQKPSRIFEQEYLARFIDDSSSVFRGVYEAAQRGPRFDAPDAPEAGHVYVAGVDLGKEYDFTTIVVVDATTRRQVYADRFNKVGYDLQAGRVARACAFYKPVTCWVETNKESAVVKRMQDDGLPVQGFYTGPANKGPLIEAWSLAIETGDVTLLNWDVLVNEHLAYEVETLPSGSFRYSAPKGAHDDTVMASALAWYGVTQTRVTHQPAVLRATLNVYGSTGRRRYPAWSKRR